MKKIRVMASILPILTSALCSGVPALAQDFLNPVTPSAPSFAANGALNSGGAVGNLNNSSNFLTGPGAFNAGTPGGRPYSVPQMQNGLMAPDSTSRAGLPMWTVPGQQPNNGPAFTFNPLSGSNQYGHYGGTSLPQVSTGFLDINTVDTPYLRSSYGTGTQIVNPYSINLNLFGLGNIDLQETQAGASTFLNDLQDTFNVFDSLF